MLQYEPYFQDDGGAGDGAAPVPVPVPVPGPGPRAANLGPDAIKYALQIQDLCELCIASSHNPPFIIPGRIRSQQPDFNIIAPPPQPPSVDHPYIAPPPGDGHPGPGYVIPPEARGGRRVLALETNQPFHTQLRNVFWQPRNPNGGAGGNNGGNNGGNDGGNGGGNDGGNGGGNGGGNDGGGGGGEGRGGRGGRGSRGGGRGRGRGRGRDGGAGLAVIPSAGVEPVHKRGRHK
jgi:hypothetical protein